MIRSILGQRSPKTRIITNARSSLQNGSVLVWLLGDQRVIREDARLFFRRANVSVDGDATAEKTWKEGDLKNSESDSEMDTEEIAYAKVLQLINEFLPVKELAGKAIELSVLHQFGLVENEELDSFLAIAFGRAQESGESLAIEPKQKRVRAKSKVSESIQVQK